MTTGCSPMSVSFSSSVLRPSRIASDSCGVSLLATPKQVPAPRVTAPRSTPLQARGQPQVISAMRTPQVSSACAEAEATIWKEIASANASAAKAKEARKRAPRLPHWTTGRKPRPAKTTERPMTEPAKQEDLGKPLQTSRNPVEAHPAPLGRLIHAPKAQETKHTGVRAERAPAWWRVPLRTQWQNMQRRIDQLDRSNWQRAVLASLAESSSIASVESLAHDWLEDASHVACVDACVESS